MHLQFLFNCLHCPHFIGRASEAGMSKVVWRRSHTFKQHSCKKDIAAWQLLWAIKTCSSQGGEDHSVRVKQISWGKWATFQRHLLFKTILKERRYTQKVGRRGGVGVALFGGGCLSCPYLWLPINNAGCDKLSMCILISCSLPFRIFG